MDDLEILTSTIAVVFPPLNNIELDEEMLTSCLESPVNVSQFPDGGTLISGARSQMEVVLHPNKVNVRELSGDRELGAKRIPKVVHSFLGFLNVEQPSSFGINYLLEIMCENPSEWVGGKFLAPGLSETFKPASQLRSNNLDVVIERHPKLWTIRFQVRRNDRVQIDFNSSEELGDQPLYEGDVLCQQIVEQGRQLASVVGEIKG